MKDRRKKRRRWQRGELVIVFAFARGLSLRGPSTVTVTSALQSSTNVAWTYSIKLSRNTTEPGSNNKLSA